jgi:hypothetical protein
MKRSTLHRIAARLDADCAHTQARHAPAQNACRAGYVWPEAFPEDRVCMISETRAHAAVGCRVSSASPRAASSAGATVTGWSDWSRAAGVEYRYRRGLNPQEVRSAGGVDAVFQVRSLQTRTAR